jgi:hypothetical protein
MLCNVAVVEAGVSLAFSARMLDLFLPNIIAQLEFNVAGSFEWVMETSAEVFQQVSHCAAIG